MDRRHALKALSGLALCPVCAVAARAAEGAHWGFSAPTGPDKWGELDPAYKVCSTGTQQSPVDITGPIKAQLPRLKIAWGKTSNTLVNNGHTIQVNVGSGGSLTVGKDSYKLVQFHFHRPSEHRIAGKSFPMEAHFVHAAPSGALAVIGVMLAEGKSNPVFHKIIATMPAQEGPAIAADPAINPAGLLPAGRDYYRYQGSLTTPPCSETVEWLLLTDSVQVAAADIAGFGKLYAMNARPVQALNRRTLLRLD